MEIYLVGGAVRDQQIGLQPKEFDWVVVGSSEEEMLNQGYLKVGKDFPVFLHPETKEEYALARTERKTSAGYYGFICDSSPKVTLEEDLLRRDLTINAIAQDKNGNLIDPFGGSKDLKKKLLRHVSNAFVEDPLRVLRTARFYAKFGDLGFIVADETKNLITKIIQNKELENLVPERVWQETYKALTTRSPWLYFTLLQECGALKIIFPELDKLFGTPQKKEYHPEVDTGLHTILTLKQTLKLSTDPVVLFASLCHDLGKGTTPKKLLPAHHGHEERGVALIKNWCKKYAVPNKYRDFAVIVSKWHLHCHKVFELKPATILKLLTGINAFRNSTNLDNFIICCEADAKGRTGKEDIDYPQAKFLKQAFEIVSSISSKDIKKNISGKQLGTEIYNEKLKKLKAFIFNNFKKQN